MSKRAQAAMEFLMTYGWAIMVVLIVIGALAYFGVLNPQRLLPPKCTFPTGLSCRDHIVTASGDEVKINLVNGLGKAIYIRNVSADPLTGNPITAPCNATMVSALYVRNGDSVDLNLNSSCTIANMFVDPNTKYRWDINLDYYYADSDASYTKTISAELLTSIEE